MECRAISSQFVKRDQTQADSFLDVVANKVGDVIISNGQTSLHHSQDRVATMSAGKLRQVHHAAVELQVSSSLCAKRVQTRAECFTSVANHKVRGSAITFSGQTNRFKHWGRLAMAPVHRQLPDHCVNVVNRVFNSQFVKRGQTQEDCFLDALANRANGVIIFNGQMRLCKEGCLRREVMEVLISVVLL